MSERVVPGNGVAPDSAWNRDVILARIEAVIDPAEFRLLQRHLAGEIDGAEAAWLQHVIDAAATLPLPAPPEELTTRLRDMFTVAAPVEHIEAVLLHDSRVERELVGVRGGGVDDGWTMTFATDIGKLLIDVFPAGDGFDVEAQLMALAGAPDFTMSVDGPGRFDAVSDRLGRARIREAPPGIYNLTINRTGVALTAHVDLPETAR